MRGLRRFYHIHFWEYQIRAEMRLRKIINTFRGKQPCSYCGVAMKTIEQEHCAYWECPDDYNVLPIWVDSVMFTQWAVLDDIYTIWGLLRHNEISKDPVERELLTIMDDVINKKVHELEELRPYLLKMAKTLDRREKNREPSGLGDTTLLNMWYLG